MAICILFDYLYVRYIYIRFAANEMWADTETAKGNDEKVA